MKREIRLHIFRHIWLQTGAAVAMKATATIASIVLLTAITTIPAAAADLTFENTGATGLNPVKVEAQATTGLEAVYVLPEFNAMTTVRFPADGGAAASSAKWSCFSNLGGGFAEPVASRTEGNMSVINLATVPGITNQKGIGFIVEYGGRQHCYWLVNYAHNACTLGSLTMAPEQECDRTALIFDGHAEKITYYSINGVAQTLSRDMELTYNTLAYDEERRQYVQDEISHTLEFADAVIRVEAPLCNTQFALSTDRFKREWGQNEEIFSPEFTTQAIAATTYATQAERSNDNEQREDKAPLGGSGPAGITFTAEVTDAVVYKEWQFARDQQFDVIDLRIQELEVTHTFRDYGTNYVRFVAGNDSGSCDYIGETYEVYIGESRLECPNTFSPGATEGTNDEWKVSYKSIIEFDCHIFNRWGLEMAHLTDPSQGWDGRHKGKLVPSGVYYYVIKAKGSDGQDYKLSGDINILKYTNDSSTNGTR